MVIQGALSFGHRVFFPSVSVFSHGTAAVGPDRACLSCDDTDDQTEGPTSGRPGPDSESASEQFDCKSQPARQCHLPFQGSPPPRHVDDPQNIYIYIWIAGVEAQGH
jgi:hypothetical protein